MFENYENFTAEEKNTLEKFVTNTDKSIFALYNLPEVIKGALFSRYSRSKLGLRTLLLKEFISNDAETQFNEIAASTGDASHQFLAIQKAQSFYDRILDGYGDDSIGELGGAHLAFENISQLAAKAIQDCRIGGSPLEKSTRYIAFDQKVEGNYLYYREPVLLESKHAKLFIETCDMLFETYSKLIPPLTEELEKSFPKDAGTSQAAYQAALRAKVLDCLRGLLPAATLTNMGVFGNGRFFEGLLHKLQNHPLQEMKEIGKLTYDELYKIIPSFIRRAESGHRTFESYKTYSENLTHEISQVSVPKHSNQESYYVKLIDFDPKSPEKVAQALLFEENVPLDVKLTASQVEELLENVSSARTMRRHKSPRALELASFTFEVSADFGAYRDVHRHRMLTQQRQLLTCDLGYYVPEELIGTSFEEPYKNALDQAKKAFDIIVKDFPQQAQYVVPMAYNVRWYIHANLRSLQWVTELRSQAAGHPSYRKIAQDIAQEICTAVPQFARFFQFVDNTAHSIGRIEQEKKLEAKRIAGIK